MNYKDSIFKMLSKNTIPEIISDFSGISKKTGASFFAIYGGLKQVGEVSSKKSYSTYPKEWLDYYSKKGFSETDPIHKEFNKTSKSIYWDALHPKFRLIKECREYDLNYGISVPIKNNLGDYLVTFSFKEEPKHILGCSAQKNLLESISSVVASKIHERSSVIQSVSLSNREIECLRWFSEGKTLEEIGIILSITHWTVIFHLNNVCKKLGVYNKTSAILKAVKLGII